MQRVIKQSRALFLLLAFVLVFAPMSALADVGEKKTVYYVALGDSLAKGMLFDRSDSDGYAGYIKSDLEFSGYEVELVNKGVDGATSEAVLAGIPGIKTDLENVDIITISAGANDVLAGLDPSLLEYLVPGKGETLVKVAKEAAAAAGIASATALKAFDEAKAPVITAKAAVQDLQDAVNAVKEEIKPFEDFLPTLVKTALDAIFADIEIAVASLKEAENELTKAKEKFITDPGAAAVLFETLDGNLGTAEQKLTSVVTNTGIIEDFIGGATIPIPDDLKAAVQDVKAKAIEAVESASNAKGSVVKAKDAINVAIEAQSTAKSAAEIAESAATKKAELARVIGAIPGKIEAVGANMVQTIGAIKKINPTAKIYVMGYYNALPYLSLEVQDGMTIPLLNDLNKVIEEAAEHFDATFIPTFKLIEGDYRTYLPNETNIHPSKAGYRVLANAFIGEISDGFPGYSEPEPPIELTVYLKEKVNVFAGQHLIINDKDVSLLLPTDLPEGTTLTVTSTNDDALAKAKGLKDFGAVLNFSFEFPEGFEDFTGKYALFMGYDEGSPDDVNIYYFNEKDDIWESQKGEVDKEAQEISLEVSLFSNYGVFAKAEVKEDPPVVKDPEDKTPPVVKDPKNPPKGVDQGDGSSKKPTKPSDGEKLPKTATNNFHMLIIGTILLASGLTSLIIMRKRRVIPSKF